MFTGPFAVEHSDHVTAGAGWPSMVEWLKAMP